MPVCAATRTLCCERSTQHGQHRDSTQTEPLLTDRRFRILPPADQYAKQPITLLMTLSQRRPAEQYAHWNTQVNYTGLRRSRQTDQVPKPDDVPNECHRPSESCKGQLSISGKQAPPATLCIKRFASTVHIDTRVSV